MELPYIHIKKISVVDKKTATLIQNFFSTKIFPTLKFSNDKKEQMRLNTYELLQSMLLELFPTVKQVDIHYNENGKLYLNGELESYYVNVSHSGKYVMSGIAKTEIGVDIQRCRKISDEMLHLLAPEALDNTVLLSDMERIKLFCRIESVIKAQGKTIFSFFSGINANNITSREFIVSEPNYVAYASFKKEYLLY